MLSEKRVIAIIPALNEAPSIGAVLGDISSQKYHGSPVVDSVIVCDNGSTDGTGDIAKSMGAETVFESKRSYGAACQKALQHYWASDPKTDDILVFIDADHSVDMSELNTLLAPMTEGADLVIGNRNASEGAHSVLTPQQRFGNWLATGLIRLMWQVPVYDLGPFRCVRAQALRQMNMQDRGFGWTCEMQIRAAQDKLVVVEVPVSVKQRIGRSKISGTLMGSLRAGWGILSTVFGLWLLQTKARRDGVIQEKRLKTI
ncbi:MAG: glycosyltransferase family 2 protein [Pseudomonadota bacterium]